MARKKAPERLMVKASVLVDARTHALWSACASLSGMDRSAFAAEAIKQACSGIILVDRRKGPDRADKSHRPELAGEISPDGPQDAA